MNPIGMTQTIYGLAKKIYVQTEQAKATGALLASLKARLFYGLTDGMMLRYHDNA